MTITHSSHRPALSRHPYPHPTGGRTSLYLVRHGRTRANVDQVLCGHTDLPLDDHGREQAALVAARIADAVEADALLTSPLRRAFSTAEAISALTGLTPQIVPDLIEMNFGIYEGAHFETILEADPELAARFLDLDDGEVGWPEGDTRVGFHRRVVDAFSTILSGNHDRSVIVVAHGGVFGSYLAQIHGSSPNDWRGFQIKNCSITHLEVSIEHTAVHLINDVEHLASIADDETME
ncbi:MAG: histidine phosphatase family protein [Thermomicrobiales bacterium]